MPSTLEIVANAVNAASIVLAARNSVHTWWTGIIGCALFLVLFYENQLYADSLLQLFFIGTSIYGWRLWAGYRQAPPRPVSRIDRRTLGGIFVAALLVGGAYGFLLLRFTDAFAPFVDALILVLSVSAQLLLMKRLYETWWFWIGVNVLSVSLFYSRGLFVTAALYTFFLANAAVAAFRWRRYLTAS